MSKSAKTRAPSKSSGPIILSVEERIALSEADAAASVTAAHAERDLARLQARQLQLEVGRMEAEKQLAEARNQASDARQKRRDLAQELASRYAINWTTHALEPMTGAIVALDGSETAPT